jgi:hypothetical protein
MFSDTVLIGDRKFYPMASNWAGIAILVNIKIDLAIRVVGTVL